jgi:hypothetical protein
MMRLRIEKPKGPKGAAKVVDGEVVQLEVRVLLRR